MIVSDVITPVKAMLFPYIGPIKLAEGAMLQVLASLDRQIYMEMSRLVPELIMSADIDIAVLTDARAPGDNGSGYNVTTAAIKITGIYYLRDSDGIFTKVKVVQEKNRATRESPAVWIQKVGTTVSVIHPVDPFGKNWDSDDQASRPWFNDAADKIIVAVIAEPAAITTLASTLNSPIIAQSYLEAELYLRSLFSVNGVPEETIQIAIQTSARTKADLMLQMYKFDSAEIMAMQERGGTSESIRSRLF